MNIEITQDIRYVGVNDHQVDLFEGQYPVPNGISYNSYVILDEKIAVMDTVDRNFAHEWLDNLAAVSAGLFDCAAYGAGPFGKYCQFYETLSAGGDCGFGQSFCHDAEFFRHRFCGAPSGGGRK